MKAEIPITLAGEGPGHSSAPPAFGLSPWLLGLLGFACGLLVASLYFGQPLAGLIAASLGLPRQASGLVVTLPLTGYGFGLLLIVPLGDLLENRRLVTTLMVIEAACLAIISVMSQPYGFFLAAFCLGLAGAVVQIILPYVTHLASEQMRGRALARLVSSIMLGIMLARPVASFVADVSAWPVIFRLASAVTLLLALLFMRVLPRRQPEAGLDYGQLLASMRRIFVATPVLRRRAFYQAMMFGSFSTFWTAVPLWLTGAPFHLTQGGVAWVALAGVAGALAPPFASRAADRGWSDRGTVAAMLMALAAFLLTNLIGDGSARSIGVIVVAAIVLDFAVSANLVFGQRAIYALGAEQRSRLNALFMATFFVGGAVASAVAGWCFAHFGWIGASVLGGTLPIVGLLYAMTGRRRAD